MRTFIVALFAALVASVASAQTRSVFIEDLTWPEIRDAQAAGKTLGHHLCRRHRAKRAPT